MGLSSNQARFLSLTARQVDLEHRIQQICQRRLRLSSELENVSTAYNNSISNRKMFTPTMSGIQALTVSGIEKLGYKVIGMGVNTDRVKDRPAVNTTGKIVINSQEEFLNIVSKLNAGQDLNKDYVLNCDIDLSGYDTGGSSLIKGSFTGTFDGNGHTIDNLNINSATGNIGMFQSVYGGKVSNIALTNCNITATSGWVGAIAGGIENGGKVDNCYASGSITASSNVGGIAGFSQGTISNSTADVDVTATNGGCAGGIIGNNSTASVVKNCVSTGDIKDTTTGWTCYDVGGLAGGNYGGHIENSSASGNVNVTSDVFEIGNFVGTNSGGGTITNCMGTGNVSGYLDVSGFAGNFFGTGSTITYCYTTGTVTGNAGSVNGFTRSTVAGNTNFYQNNISADAGGADKGVETTGWNTSVWDLSGSLPTLKDAGYTAYTDNLEAGLRNGSYSLAKEADEFSQDTITIGNNKYQEIDWRQTPEIYDELYKGDDVDAENKYDKTIEEINAQDKKLQLEQTSIEVEYKAVNSEKESVKKILDTNAQSSFKYFS